MASLAVAVFCGSSLGSKPAYSAAARPVASCCAEAKATLVFGGSGVGLMGVLLPLTGTLGIVGFG